MAEVIFRRLQPDRLDELEKVFELNVDEHSTRQKNLADGREVCLVAEYDEQYIGMVAVSLENENAGAAVVKNQRAYFYGMVVKERYRGMGVGKNLLLAAIRVATALGYREQSVAVSKDDEIALSLYTKFGFRPFLQEQKVLLGENEVEFDLYLRKT